MSRVNIITRCFNRLEYTVLNIRSCFEMAKGARYTHIIVDQNSSDGTRQWLKSLECEGFYPIKVLYNNTNSGDAGGMFDGYNICDNDCDYILQLDNDLTPITPDFINKLTDVMDSDQSIGSIMLRRKGVRAKVGLTNNCKTVNGIALCEPVKLYSVFFRKNILDQLNHWGTTKIGWVFSISKKIKELGFDVMKTHDIEMLHVDGYRDVVDHGTEQVFRYPKYFESIKTGSNYKNIHYT